MHDSINGTNTIDQITNTIETTKAYEAKYFGLDSLDHPNPESIWDWDDYSRGRPLQHLGAMLELAEADAEWDDYDRQYKDLLRQLEESAETIKQLCEIPAQHKAKIITVFNEIHIKPFEHYKEETEKDKE